MAIIRYLACAASMCALAAGCSQSLFDANPGGDGGSGGGRDSGEERDGAPPVRPDARVGDAGVDGSGPPIPSNCPMPCAGDAAGDYDGSPDGSNGRWRYVELRSATSDYAEMTSTTYPPGTTLGNIGTGDPAPGIANCDGPSGVLPCDDQGGSLVFITTKNTGANHPAIRWTAPTAGRYQLSGSWKFPFSAPMETNILYVSVNDQPAILEVPTGLTAGTFETTATLEEGDAVTLTAIVDSDIGTYLGVNVYITGPSSPASFQGVQP